MQQPNEKPLKVAILLILLIVICSILLILLIVICSILLILLIVICSLESFLILTERVNVTANSEIRLFFNTQGRPNVHNESFVFATNNTEECRTITTYVRVSMMVPLLR